MNTEIFAGRAGVRTGVAMRGLVAGLMAAGACGTAMAHDMVEVGLTSSLKQLTAHYDITFPIPLQQSFIDTVPGFADAALGFEALLFDDEIEQVFKLPGDCDIRVMVTSFDPEMRLWNDHTTAALGVGEAFNLGQPYFHTHPIWQITPDGKFDQTYSITLVLQDKLGNYADSEPFTVSFTPVPGPGALGLVGAAGLMGARRRR